ncbi:hypothetical protein ACET3Z_022413 [Daucus carota]
MSLLLPSPCSSSSSFQLPVTGAAAEKCKTRMLMMISGGNSRARMSGMSITKKKRQVWLWTESQQVMTTAVERGWTTFLFSSPHLPTIWSSIARINPLFMKDGEIYDVDDQIVATFSSISSPEELKQFQPSDEQPDIVIVNLLDWQAIPAENIVAAFQGTDKRVMAVSKTPKEAQMFLEALELGLGGVVLKVEDVKAVLDMKEYFDRIDEVGIPLGLTRATVSQVQMTGMGDRVCVDLCTMMKPGEGLLVGSFARGLFLVHSECLETSYISSRPFRVNAGPVHAYVAVPGGKTCYLSELRSGKEVIVVDQSGNQRSAVVGRVKIETRPLILVEAKAEMDNVIVYSTLLQNAETVALISPNKGNGSANMAIPVTALKVGDEVLMRVQGGARHTGIEIQEFIVEK